MNIISHNTFSYLPVRQWWMKPFGWLARCQSMDISDQFSYGMTGIDLRIRFDRKGHPVLAHGMVEYDADAMRIIAILKDWDITNGNGTCMRVMLETTSCMNDIERRRQKLLFADMCRYLKALFNNIVLWGGWPRDEWGKKVYDFGTDEPSVTEMHASVAWRNSDNRFRRTFSWLPNLWIRSWAKRHNNEIISKAQTDWCMIDFVEYRLGRL